MDPRQRNTVKGPNTNGLALSTLSYYIEYSCFILSYCSFLSIGYTWTMNGSWLSQNVWQTCTLRVNLFLYFDAILQEIKNFILRIADIGITGDSEKNFNQSLTMISRQPFSETSLCKLRMKLLEAFVIDFEGHNNGSRITEQKNRCSTYHVWLLIHQIFSLLLVIDQKYQRLSVSSVNSGCFWWPRKVKYNKICFIILLNSSLAVVVLYDIGTGIGIGRTAD